LGKPLRVNGFGFRGTPFVAKTSPAKNILTSLPVARPTGASRAGDRQPTFSALKNKAYEWHGEKAGDRTAFHASRQRGDRDGFVSY